MAPQETFAASFAARVRERAEAKGLTSMKLADDIGVKRSAMSNYWSGARPYPAEVIPRLAQSLNTNVEWLFTGVDRPRHNPLVDATAADWVTVPTFDLRHMTDASLGEPTAQTPMRRDWLSSTVRATTNVWLTQLPADYQPADLTEGTLVLCRSVTATDLSEGSVCIWRFHTNLVVGRFSVVPDVAAATGKLRSAQDIVAPERYFPTRPEVVVSPSQIGDGDDHYHLVGRILGVFMRPL